MKKYFMYFCPLLNVAKMNRRIPKYLAKGTTNVYLLMFLTFFTLFFVNVFAPFKDAGWFNNNQYQTTSLYSTCVIVGGLVVMIISRIIMHFVNKKKLLSVLAYVLWLFAEIFIITILYLIISKTVLHDSRPAQEIFKRALIYIPTMLVIPYLISYLFIGLKTKELIIRELRARSQKVGTVSEEIADDTVNFTDEKGKLRLSIKKSSILFLESNDNYVNIHYMDKGKLEHSMLRNKIKALEPELTQMGFARCHRSYMANLQKIKLISRDKEGFSISFDESDGTRIPLSKTYADTVMQRFSE